MATQKKNETLKDFMDRIGNALERSPSTTASTKALANRTGRTARMLTSEEARAIGIRLMAGNRHMPGWSGGANAKCYICGATGVIGGTGKAHGDIFTTRCD